MSKCPPETFGAISADPHLQSIAKQSCPGLSFVLRDSKYFAESFTEVVYWLTAVITCIVVRRVEDRSKTPRMILRIGLRGKDSEKVERAVTVRLP